MEDILKCYGRASNPLEPVIAVDEVSRQLLSDKYPSKRCRPGKVGRYDCEYVRKGTCNLFVMVRVDKPGRRIQVTRRRRKKEFAQFMKDVSEKDFPQARRIHVIMDNLNIHFETSFLETYGEREGGRLWKKFKPHYTPKHASWLNVAENEISALTRQCLRERIESEKEMKSKVRSWSNRRIRSGIGVEWKFDIKKAKKKFPNLYH